MQYLYSFIDMFDEYGACSLALGGCGWYLQLNSCLIFIALTGDRSWGRVKFGLPYTISSPKEEQRGDKRLRKHDP